MTKRIAVFSLNTPKHTDSLANFGPLLQQVRSTLIPAQVDPIANQATSLAVISAVATVVVSRVSVHCRNSIS